MSHTDMWNPCGLEIACLEQELRKLRLEELQEMPTQSDATHAQGSGVVEEMRGAGAGEAELEAIRRAEAIIARLRSNRGTKMPNSGVPALALTAVVPTGGDGEQPRSDGLAVGSDGVAGAVVLSEMEISELERQSILAKTVSDDAAEKWHVAKRGCSTNRVAPYSR